jgi:hypothetical protein
MNLSYAIGGQAACALLFYLLIALFKPEDM